MNENHWNMIRYKQTFNDCKHNLFFAPIAVLIVTELLEYCEELDDSQEESEESVNISDKDKMETN